MRVALIFSLMLVLALPALAGAPVEDKVLKQIDNQIAQLKIDKNNATWRTSLPKPTKVEFESGKTYFARMQTNKGPVLIKFLPQVAPMHVTSFMYLARLGFYDGLA